MGMQVLADLHGGHVSNMKAEDEFREIKEGVLRDVRPHSDLICKLSLVLFLS